MTPALLIRISILDVRSLIDLTALGTDALSNKSRSANVAPHRGVSIFELVDNRDNSVPVTTCENDMLSVLFGECDYCFCSVTNLARTGNQVYIEVSRYMGRLKHHTYRSCLWHSSRGVQLPWML
jgi:hypothetical protein